MLFFSYLASILTKRNPSRPLNRSIIASILSTFLGSCAFNISKTLSLASAGSAFFICSVSTSVRRVGFTIPLALPALKHLSFTYSEICSRRSALRLTNFGFEGIVLSLLTCDKLRQLISFTFRFIQLGFQLLRFILCILEIVQCLFMHLFFVLPPRSHLSVTILQNSKSSRFIYRLGAALRACLEAFLDSTVISLEGNKLILRLFLSPR